MRFAVECDGQRHKHHNCEQFDGNRGCKKEVGKSLKAKGLSPDKVRKKEKGEAFKPVVESQFQRDKRGYYERLRLVSLDANKRGADILVLPACAMMYKEKFNAREILGDDVPGIVAAGRLHIGQHCGPLLEGEDSILLRAGQPVAAIDEAVLWIGLKGKPFSILAAVSSTIKHVRTEHWAQRPSRPGKWVLPPALDHVPKLATTRQCFG